MGLVAELKHGLLSARSAVFYYFMLEGYFNAVWSVYLPLQQTELGLSDSLIGAASLFNYGGQVLSTLATAPFLRRMEARNVVITGALLFCCSMFLIPMAHSFTTLCLVFAFFGITEGIMDVSMNANAVLTETVAERPLLGTYHGSYSVAAALGGLIGGAFVYRDFAQQVTYSISGAVGIALALVSYLQLYSLTVERELTASYPQTAPLPQPDSLAPTAAYSSIPAESTGDKQQNEKPTTSPLILLASVGFLAAAGEGAVVTWVTIWFTRSFSSAPGGLYSIGFTCFMSSMALGRFCCDALRQLVGRRTMFKCAGLLACGGVCIIALAPSTLPEPTSLFVACFGCCVTGLGLSTLMPTVFSSAGHLPNVHPGTAISRVAFWTYAGSIVSPPLIGALSDAFDSLQLGFIVLAALLFLITPLGSRVPPEPQRGGAGGNKIDVEAMTTPLLPAQH